MRSALARSSEPVPVAVPVARRGVTRITQFELRTRYPFGWFHAWTYVQGSLTAYVAPVAARHPNAAGRGRLRTGRSLGSARR